VYAPAGKFYQTGNVVIDVSDATSANTASKVVQRDANGDFSAGTITSTLNGVMRYEFDLSAAPVDLIKASLLTGTDRFRLRVGANGSDNQFVELATCDNGNETFYVSQYTGGYSDASEGFTTLKNRLTLLDASGNTAIPNNLSVGGTITAGGTPVASGNHQHFIEVARDGSAMTPSVFPANAITGFSSYGPNSDLPVDFHWVGMVVRTSADMGMQFAVNWDYNGKTIKHHPYIRVQDDTHKDWSPWRALAWHDELPKKFSSSITVTSGSIASLSIPAGTTYDAIVQLKALNVYGRYINAESMVHYELDCANNTIYLMNDYTENVTVYVTMLY
jgi:hypothetical protein